ALNGLTHLYTIEAKQPYPWKAIFCLIVLGIAQIAAGVTIAVCTYGTGANYASALIGEGISDLMAAGNAAWTGRFDWKEWGIQKAISMLSSMTVAGLNSISKGFKKAWEAVQNIGTFNTGIGKNNLEAITKQVAGNIAKSAVKEAINYGLDEITNELLVNYIKETIEHTVAEKLAQLITDHPLMHKALALDVAQKSSHWQNTFTQEGLAILTKTDHPFVKFLHGLSKSIAAKVINLSC
ncbi:hypothetical protein GR268_41085, partial [Rhizobium leguminosarum]|nr:hypothetical protein [Rhizobium leguminosarum]